MSQHDPATLAFYAREAAAYAVRSRSPSERLQAFLARIRPGARILDLGCGAGQDARLMQDLGFDVTAMDGSPELALEAERLIGRPVRIQLFEHLDDRCAYDAVWANASLLHVPKPALPAIFVRIHRALTPRGLLNASFKSGGQEGRDALGRYYNYPSAEELRLALSPPDWTSFEFVEGHGAGYDGVVTGWITVTAQKN